MHDGRTRDALKKSARRTGELATGELAGLTSRHNEQPPTTANDAAPGTQATRRPCCAHAATSHAHDGARDTQAHAKSTDARRVCSRQASRACGAQLRRAAAPSCPPHAEAYCKMQVVHSWPSGESHRRQDREQAAHSAPPLMDAPGRHVLTSQHARQVCAVNGRRDEHILSTEPQE